MLVKRMHNEHSFEMSFEGGVVNRMVENVVNRFNLFLRSGHAARSSHISRSGMQIRSILLTITPMKKKLMGGFITTNEAMTIVT